MSMASLLRRGVRMNATLQEIRSVPALLSVAAQRLTSRGLAHSYVVCAPIHVEEEPYCRQRQVLILGNRVPTTAPDTWIAGNAVVVGDVDMYDKVSIWYGCVLRGDLNGIRVGAWSNVQDRTVIHAARTSPTGLPAATVIGTHVTIGPGCVLRSCHVQDQVIIGEKSVLMEGSLVEKNAVLAPGSVVPPGRLIPSGQLWAGNPARYVRDLTKDEIAEIVPLAEGMFPLIMEHQDSVMEESYAYLDADRVKEKLKDHAAYKEFVTMPPLDVIIPQNQV